jgi:transcriptional regulator of nitric oxide reductase
MARDIAGTKITWRVAPGLAAMLLVFVAVWGAPAAEVPASGSVESRFPEVFSEATAFGPMEGAPPAAAAYRQGTLVGYIFESKQVVASSGFSGKPLNVLAGVDLDGRITGAVILEHKEPILVIGVSDRDLAAFVAQYRGLDIRDPVRVSRRPGGGEGRVDAVVGATISSVVFSDVILRAARAVARSRGLLGEIQALLDFESFETVDWQALGAEGSLVSLSIAVGAAEAAVNSSGGRLYGRTVALPDPNATFLELHTGLATPARVGRNLLGGRLYNRLMGELSEGDQLLFVAGRGLYSFKGTAYVRGGVFDRIQLVQGERTIRFAKDDHSRVEKLALTGAPELRELAVFVLRQATGFSAVEPWRLEILVAGEADDGRSVYASFARPYRLPSIYQRGAEGAETQAAAIPLWQDIWRERWLDVAVLVLGLTALTVILVFQDFVERQQPFYEALRIGFLTFTLVWLGWIVGAQLSVVNVLTFSDAVMTEFHWDFFLLDPMLFILWSYVAVAMLFWGRGVFCGWLCPFGALQELANRLAQRFRVPQWRLPFGLHERLWPVKYIVFLAIFAVFLGDQRLALTGAEVEPFKTAIVLKFDRPWPFVFYALALVVAGLFVKRAFCRYLCPLGAALALPARLRMFEWLKRRWQCGTPCQQCALTCPVQAIHPEGRINPNECIHCLRCQVNYYDDQLCPPVIERRKRRERRQTARQAKAEAAEAGEGAA